MSTNRGILLLKDEEEVPKPSFKYLLKVDNNWEEFKKLYNDVFPEDLGGSSRDVGAEVRQKK